MADILVILIILAIVGGAIAYIVKHKKKGVNCIGCPNGANCSHSCDGCQKNIHVYEE